MLPTPAVNATSASIPIAGRFSTYTIGVRIPMTPRWAHDIVLNATVIWNDAQVWYGASALASGKVYSLVESDDGGASISFTMPAAYSKIAVGWTDYEFASSSRIILSTRTYLDPTVFNVAQASNVTAREYALRLALHELGRVLGLGSVLDGRDIMDPRATPSSAESPVISTLDLYALSVLASGSVPSFVTLPSTTPDQFVDAATFISTGSSGFIPTPEFNGYYGMIATITAATALLLIRRRRTS
jgi:hypothetical protein